MIPEELHQWTANQHRHRARWGQQFALAEALLAAAENALEGAETNNDFGERRRQVQIFELYMAAAMHVDS
jgi:ferric-dicitrate binding protein FerR (iron transport regulator)